ncbi:MAG: hypothetical protein A2X59_08160 [Nitrospirae bacterium GWC2_42_7]|nr:MAG: hypothetical protein A2X59_08160 [Nitrospirae bacterium GWC2_42_7]
MDISIIIVSYNTRDLLDACIESIRRTTQSISYELIVADNASHDGTQEMLLRKYPDVKVILNKENHGFAAATNQGVRAARGEYVLLLNPDTVILKGAIERCVSFLAEQGENDLVACRVLNTDGSVQRTWKGAEFYSLRAQFLMLTGMERFCSNALIMEKAKLKHFDPNKTQTVAYVAGCFMLMRKNALVKLGLMDENFFLYSEDGDLCFRIRRSGGAVHYYSGAEIIHYGGQSTKAKALKSHHLFLVNRFKFYKKNFGFARAVIYRIIMALGAFIKISSLLMNPPAKVDRSKLLKLNIHTLMWCAGFIKSLSRNS